LAERQAVCVGLISYDGRIDFGLVGDYDAMPGLHSLGLDLERAIDELVATVEDAPAASERERSANGRRARA
jgi:diacylglycerol O-acyltransferase / wax synthase